MASAQILLVACCLAVAQAGLLPAAYAPVGYATAEHPADHPVQYAEPVAPVAYAAAEHVAPAAPVAYAAAEPAVAPVAYAAAKPVVPAVAYAAAPVAYAAKSLDFDPNPEYKFSYDVQDDLTGDSKSQTETRKGDVVHGSYSLDDPDGTRRTVDYTSDPVNGFNAVVRKEPQLHKYVVPAAPAYAAPAAPVAYAAYHHRK